jgi:hypothetical protein
MGDIAFVFGWVPAVMDAMSLTEIVMWRDQAARRHNPPKD